MTPASELPMFPLGTVLFPSTALPVHVFEPRYRALTHQCLEGDGRLGIVLIERGSEVGGGDVRFGVGTRARVVEAVELPDGRWLLGLLGEERIRVLRWLPEEPFPRAEVVAIRDAGTGREAVRLLRALKPRLSKALALQAELGDASGAGLTVDLADDPAVAGYQAAALAPIGAADAQRVLETDDVAARLRLLATLLDEQIDVLAQRLAGR